MSDDIGDPGTPMSDSKKPTVSEIRARAGNPFPSNTGQMLLSDIPHLLDLVERMGESISGFIATHAHDFVPIEQSDCTCPACMEARELLKEIEL